MEAAKLDGEEERVEEDGGLRGSAVGDGTRVRDSAGRLNRVMGASSPAVGTFRVAGLLDELVGCTQPSSSRLQSSPLCVV